jgi:molybdopterin-guanine dinucleotide biosynthesis protein A
MPGSVDMTPRCAGVVLAGGRSARMGTSKAALE